MASKDLCIFILVATILAQATSVPAADNPQQLQSGFNEFVVGDCLGWDVWVDYPAWVEGKDFYVGDKFVFKYEKGKHNVYKLKDKARVNACNVPPQNDLVGSSGNDVITLDEMGGVGFLSGIDKDCLHGMKLYVEVKCPNMRPKALQGGRKLVTQNNN